MADQLVLISGWHSFCMVQDGTEPMTGVSLRETPMKTAVAKRVSELDKLSISPTYLQWKADSSGVTLLTEYLFPAKRHKPQSY